MLATGFLYYSPAWQSICGKLPVPVVPCVEQFHQLFLFFLTSGPSVGDEHAKVRLYCFSCRHAAVVNPSHAQHKIPALCGV